MDKVDIDTLVELAFAVEEGDPIDFRGIVCKAPITDHYWWISIEHGLQNMLGDTPKAYIADTWLEPIRPEKQFQKEEERLDLSV